jgi:ABC-type phosphate transport system substrate-binding protein
MSKRNKARIGRARRFAGAFLMALGLSTAGAAMSTDVFGGGATLPAGGYVGWNFLVFNPPQILSSTVTSVLGAPIDPTSLLGGWASSSGNRLAYCQTGSANGKKIFDHSSGTMQLVGATGPCNGGLGGSGGFGAVPAFVDPHFVASDAPLSQDEFNWFGNSNPIFGQKATANSQPVQFPAIVGTIAIAFNNPEAPDLNFSDAGLCKLFSGSVVDWAQFVPSDFSTMPSAGLPLRSRPLHLAYRQDGSGTTFSLANHLSTVCAAVNGRVFQTDQGFANVISQFGAPPANNVPNYSLPAMGDSGVMGAINGQVGAIGYVASGYVLHMPISTTTHVARVNGRDPFLDIPNSITLVTLLVDNVVNGVNANGTPRIQSLSPAAPKPGCVLMVNPTFYANGISGGYPILAVSNLVLNATGNGPDTPALRDMMSYVYSSARRSASTLVGAGTGYAFVTSPVANVKINTCISI